VRMEFFRLVKIAQSVGIKFVRLMKIGRSLGSESVRRIDNPPSL
jgi:hypothetical protein